jgi:hypothetical protein
LVLSEGQMRIRLLAGSVVLKKPPETRVNRPPSSIQDGLALVPSWQPAQPRPPIWSMPATPVDVFAFPVAPKWSPAGTTTVIFRVAVLLGPGGNPLLTTSCTVYVPVRCTFTEFAVEIVAAYDPFVPPATGAEMTDQE